MKFLMNIIKNRKLILQLGRNDFKNRFASTSLGSMWGFLQPFVFMFTYVIVFQYILKTGSAGEYPYVVWFLPGMSIWLSLNDSIMSASSSIRNYSYLVKKVVFPVDTIPVISIVASSFVSLFLVVIATVVCAIYGFTPNIFKLIYMLICFYVFVLSFTRFTSAVTTMVPDFEQFLGIAMQLFFWFTPIIWNLNMLVNRPFVQKIIQCMPFTYIVTGFREIFINERIIFINHGFYSIVFWVVTGLIYLWGNYIFNKSKKDFADVL